MKKVDKVLSAAENTLTGVLMLATVIILFVNVIMRYCFSAASSWAEEVIRYAIIWVTFVGGSQCVKSGTHVGVDLVLMSLPKKAKPFFYGLAQLLAGAFTAFCTVGGFQLFQMVLKTHQLSPARVMPMWIVYASLFIGNGLMTIRFIIAGITQMMGKGTAASAITDDEGNLDMSKM